MAMHTKQRSFICQECGASFLRASHFNYHMKKHQGPPTVPCQHCNMRFYRKSDLKRHLIKHTQERPFPCPQCDKKFTRVQYLRDHLHTHSQTIICNVCSVQLSTVDEYCEHISTHEKTKNSEEPEAIETEPPPVMEQIDHQEEEKVLLSDVMTIEQALQSGCFIQISNDNIVFHENQLILGPYSTTTDILVPAAADNSCETAVLMQPQEVFVLPDESNA
eukprot:GHVO01036131.1.p1 GENE.GHVO01036131.1~~GHVO01036131.1.p1  ORF type:complete len:219 (-),score=13.99 GHVO01036131.1:215-871(-)